MELIRNERGAGLLMAVSAVVILILTYVGALGAHVMSLNNQLSASRRLNLGYDALRDFSQMARRAHEVFRANGDSCAPVSGTHFQFPAGRPFCWPNVAGAPTVNSPFCIRYPLEGTSGTRLLCLGAGGAANPDGLEIQARIRDDLPLLRRVWAHVVVWHEEKILDAVARIEREVENVAHAQANSIIEQGFWPAMTGAPSLSAYYVNCNGGTAVFPCKYCENYGGVDTTLDQLRCINLRVCMRATGGCGPNDFVSQSVGFIPR